MVGMGFESRERKEIVVIGVEGGEEVVVVDDWCDCSHRDASVSGVGEFRKMSKSSLHDSIRVR